MLFLDDPLMKKDYTAGGLDAIADGVLLNNSQAAKLLGISRVKLAQIIKENNLPAARLGKGKNSPLFLRAGDLKRFLEKAFSAVEYAANADPAWAAIVENPPAKPRKKAVKPTADVKETPAEPPQTPAEPPQVTPTAKLQAVKTQDAHAAEIKKTIAKANADFDAWQARIKSQDAPQAVELPPSAVVLQAVADTPQAVELPPTPKGKKKTPDEVLAEAGLTRWRGKKGVKGYGAKG